MSILINYRLPTYSAQMLDFDQATGKAFRNHIRSWLTGNNNNLISLDDYMASRRTVGRHDMGIAMIPIGQIGGSMGRTHDFDRQFMPKTHHTQPRWIRVDHAFQEGACLPPIELLKVDDMYFVSDRHHRLSVASLHKHDSILAHVVQIETVAE